MTDTDFQQAEAARDAAAKESKNDLKEHDPLLKAEWERQIELYGKRMPHKYIKFTVKYRCFWIAINLFNIIASVIMATAGIMILQGVDDDRDTHLIAFSECQSMRVVCYALFVCHDVILLFSAMAICGLEKRMCNVAILAGAMIFEIIILTWAQIIYFQSQNYNCNVVIATEYFWLMGEILFILPADRLHRLLFLPPILSRSPTPRKRGRG